MANRITDRTSEFCVVLLNREFDEDITGPNENTESSLRVCTRIVFMLYNLFLELIINFSSDEDYRCFQALPQSE
jgi:hypothetical protein